jgi:hypothetical protein
MLHAPLLIETQDPAQPAAVAPPGNSGGKPPHSFLHVLGAHMDRRYEQEKQRRLQEQRAPQNTQPASGQDPADPPDFAMYKLYMSLLLRLGGPAPVVAASDPDASSLMHQSLKTWRCGARTPFCRDSDLYSMPRFPVTRAE